MGTMAHTCNLVFNSALALPSISHLSSPDKEAAASPGVSTLERTRPKYPACVGSNLGHLPPPCPPSTNTQGWGGVRVGLAVL